MKQSVPLLTSQDRQSLAERGVPEDEVRRQWSLLTDSPERILLDRPCTIDDGIELVTESDRIALIETHREAANEGRWQKFVPASGAASRMFSLNSAKDQARFCQSVERFAFAEQLKQELLRRNIKLESVTEGKQYDQLIDAIVSPDGLGYGRIPKGLLNFHSYQGATRTAFEEHLLEAIACLGNKDGDIRAHFTVAADRRGAFEGQLDRFKAEVDRAICHVDFSVQCASTDTIAMAADGGALRDDKGQLILRPGGHGALIENLNALHGDLIFVKNIDNAAHEHSRAASIAWTQSLGGCLVRLQKAIHQHVRSLKSGDVGALVPALEFVRLTFPNAAAFKSDSPHVMRKALLSQLNRPLRVCGMVKNEGEPGGGPFWVRERDGSDSLQIVESAELDLDDTSQRDIFSRATHFNPVFMALAVRDDLGEPFDLPRFVNQDRVITGTKQVAGQTATVLERPGLWNGGMAGWNSVFVEVPSHVFSPVKSVLDLLRPEHQPVDEMNKLPNS